jgi:hypothetical protein
MNSSFLATSVALLTSWILFSNWFIDALISPNNCGTGHCTRSVDEGAASVCAHIYSGSPLVIEWSEWVSTSSSIGGAGVILNLISVGKRVRTSVLDMQSCINYTNC